MKSRIATIARFTLLEARRARVALLAFLVLAILVGATVFVGEIVIAETSRFQAGFYAATARFAAVFIAAFYVAAAMTREFDDKGADMLLALDLPRSHYVLGKLAGFLGVGVALAAAACLPLLVLAPLQAALQWGASLAFELAIVMALALFCVVTFNQLLPAAAFVAAFYLLARTLTALRLMGASPVAGSDSMSHQAITWVIEGLALVLPAFDGWTRTAWLVNEPAAWLGIGLIAAQGALYVALLAGAAIFDLHRRNF